jgi:succinylarginine dihydrolase
VSIHPTKESAEHELEAVSDPREQSAQGMWKMAPLCLEGWMGQDALRFVAKERRTVRGQRRLAFRIGW